MIRAIFLDLKISKIRPHFLAFLDLKNRKLDVKTYFLAFIDLKTNCLAFLDLKNDCSSLYISEICLKSLFFGHIFPNFFDDLFFRDPLIFFCRPIFFPIYLIKLLLPIIFFTFLDLKKLFFKLYRPKNCFLDLKNFFRLFRRKNSFLDFLVLKISLNPLKTLRKHLFSLQIDEKNNILF